MRNDVYQASTARTARVVTCGGLFAPLGGAKHIMTGLLANCLRAQHVFARGTPYVCAMRNDVHQASIARTARVVTCGG